MSFSIKKAKKATPKEPAPKKNTIQSYLESTRNADSADVDFDWASEFTTESKKSTLKPAPTVYKGGMHIAKTRFSTEDEL